MDRNNYTTFLNFLKHFYRNSPGKELRIIMDNSDLHKHKEVTDRVNRRRRLFIHFTHTYASWLGGDMFNIFSKDVICGEVWKSKKQMIDQIILYQAL